MRQNKKLINTYIYYYKWVSAPHNEKKMVLSTMGSEKELGKITPKRINVDFFSLCHAYIYVCLREKEREVMCVRVCVCVCVCVCMVCIYGEDTYDCMHTHTHIHKHI